MSLLRIRAATDAATLHCAWTLINDAGETLSGEGALSGLPRQAGKVQLVLPAARVMITRVLLPAGAMSQRAGSTLAYAIEDCLAAEPDESEVIRLGKAGAEDVLAVIDKMYLQHWREALDAAGIKSCDVLCETLMLPLADDAWSLAWDGHEGHVRTGMLEGGITDGGDHSHPPLSLHLLLDEARARGETPAAIRIHPATPGSAPDPEAWQQALGIPLQTMDPRDWHDADANSAVPLLRENRHWQSLAGLSRRLRPAAWILGAALTLHAVAVVSDWMMLASEHRTLRQTMETRFRTVFPEAVAVVDPGLQMRRKLAEARHAAGLSDNSDFLPLVDAAAAAFSNLPPGSVRMLSYETGRLTFELGAIDASVISRMLALLRQSGLRVDTPAAGTKPGSNTLIITVRPS